MKIAQIKFMMVLYCLLITTATIYSQDKKATKKPFKKITNQDLQLNLCADDGFADFVITEIEDYVIQNIGLDNDSFKEQVLISTENGNIYAVNTPSSNPNIAFVCKFNDSFTDIAVNSNKEMFTCSGVFSSVSDQCDLNVYNNDFFGSNSLSFDNLDNVYLGYGNKSYVINFNVSGNDLINFKVWHDFEAGAAGGDFVLLNDKMYVSWRLGRENYRLYEVTINADREYISHVDLGELPDETYGLASELGTLYGVTPTKLFKINLENLTFTDIIQNSNPDNAWYGAAGINEAITYNLSTHLSQQDANNDDNIITGTWTNTIYGGQTIYVRIENSLTGDYDIVLLDINISNYPNVNQPLDLVICSDDLSIFDLNQVKEQMQIDATDTSTYSYYTTNPDFGPNKTPLPLLYQSTRMIETIHVKVNNGNCPKVYNFELINNKNPSLLPLSNLQSPKVLESCSFDKNDMGFFNLDDIKKDMISNGDNPTTSYYLSNFDAENDIDKISNIYYLENSMQEIFIRATDIFGCFTISNFFLSENCLLDENPLLYITFPDFMTPNNDGINDYWNIKGGSDKVKKESNVIIYNRYGKELFSFNPFSDLGWDGTYDGNNLPESDYWYLFTSASGLKKTGNFSLKR